MPVQPPNRRLYALRVKIKSLAAEAAIIRREEHRFPSRAQRKRAIRTAYANAGLDRNSIAEVRAGKAPKPNLELPRWASRNRSNEVYNDLHRHRTIDVRREARAAQLAYAFLRHRPYETVEPSRPLVQQLVGEYTSRDILLNNITGIAARFGTITDMAAVRAQIDSWIDSSS